MTVTDNNCVVGIEYEVKEAGKSEILDTNKGAQPLEFIMGTGQIIKGLEKGLVGMSQNDSGDILVKAEDAYGEYNSEAIQIYRKEQFEGIDLPRGA